jgi:hypothetical protein
MHDSDSDILIIFKENQLVANEPKFRHLQQLFESHGLKVESGEKIVEAFRSLHVKREGASLTKAAVVRVLLSDSDVELSPQIAE